MKIKNGFAMRKIAGNNVVVPVGKTSLEFNGMITLNDSGAFLWSCFQKDISPDEAKLLLLKEYNVDEKTATNDINSFIKILKDNNLLD